MRIKCCEFARWLKCALVFHRVLSKASASSSKCTYMYWLRRFVCRLRKKRTAKKTPATSTTPPTTPPTMGKTGAPDAIGDGACADGARFCGALCVCSPSFVVAPVCFALDAPVACVSSRPCDDCAVIACLVLPGCVACDAIGCDDAAAVDSAPLVCDVVGAAVVACDAW